jgi:predicted nucleic acid-binding protein
LDGGAISVQVINEVSANMLKKLNFSNDGIKEFIISCLNRYKIINVEPSTLLKAVEIRKQYNISYYDSSIIAAAIEANARILYSEDMQDSLTISELTIVNPFKK